MAQKRMFSLSVVDTDQFLSMPVSSRLLYYELGMRADDDGFVDNWNKILLFTGLKEDDLKLLIVKKFIIPFDSGVIVIRHWRLNNYLQKDRMKPTIHVEELKQLNLNDNNVYNLDTNCIHSIDKNSIDKNSIDYRIEKISKDKSIEKTKPEENSVALYSATSTPATQEISDKIPYKEVINYLNLKTNSHYKATADKNKKVIRARYKEGYRLEDFKKVIDIKTKEWQHTEWEKYLRPVTLFGTKFDNYLNQKEIKKSHGKILNTLEMINNGSIKIR